VIGLVDPVKASEFRRKNIAAKAEHKHHHHHHDHHGYDHDGHDHGHNHGHSDSGGGCCGELAEYFIPRSEMSSVDRLIDDKIRTDHFFRENMGQILERANMAVESICQKAKAKGMEVNEEARKELLAKSMRETVNRLIFQTVHAELKRNDQTYSKQPGLVAHPATV
jgi:hypothetical protein